MALVPPCALRFGSGEDHPAALLVDLRELFNPFEPGLHLLQPGLLDTDVPSFPSSVRLDPKVFGMLAELDAASSFFEDGADNPGPNLWVVAR